MSLGGDTRCPVCRAALWAPDNETIGSKRCPRCGAELWVFSVAGVPVFFLRQPGQTKLGFLATLAAPFHGVSVTQMEATLKDADSLDLVEIVMELEEMMRK